MVRIERSNNQSVEGSIAILNSTRKLKRPFPGSEVNCWLANDQFITFRIFLSAVVLCLSSIYRCLSGCFDTAQFHMAITIDNTDLQYVVI